MNTVFFMTSQKSVLNSMLESGRDQDKLFPYLRFSPNSLSYNSLSREGVLSSI